MAEKQKSILDFAAEVDFSRILTNPILDIAARFWESDRYEAFRVCYRSMRVIDDLVDDRKSLSEQLDEGEKEMLQQSLESWHEALRSNNPQDDFQKELLEIIERFKIPFWPWSRLCRAMIYDIHADCFPTFLTFMRYTEGAAIAPASIFMHLCGVSPKGDRFVPPPYDIRVAARPLAIFSYLVHIMRDFEKDQRRGLNYFAINLISAHELSAAELADSDAPRRPALKLRSLFQTYHDAAEWYRKKALANIEQHLPFLEPRYQLSLKMIYALYLQIFERIDPTGGEFTETALNPAPHEIEREIERTVSSFAALI